MTGVVVRLLITLCTHAQAGLSNRVRLSVSQSVSTFWAVCYERLTFRNLFYNTSNGNRQIFTTVNVLRHERSSLAVKLGCFCVATWWSRTQTTGPTVSCLGTKLSGSLVPRLDLVPRPLIWVLVCETSFVSGNETTYHVFSSRRCTSNRCRRCLGAIGSHAHLYVYYCSLVSYAMANW